MIVISDTSPISGLLIIEHLYLLEELFETIIIPDAVYQEVLGLENFGFSTLVIQEAVWIQKIILQNQHLVQKLRKDLDAGKSEAIAVAIELNAELILIDENKGRTFAHSHGLKATGTIGILLRAKERGLIKMVKPVLDRLIKEANFWISDAFYEKVLKLAGENSS